MCFLVNTILLNTRTCISMIYGITFGFSQEYILNICESYLPTKHIPFVSINAPSIKI